MITSSGAVINDRFLTFTEKSSKYPVHHRHFRHPVPIPNLMEPSSKDAFVKAKRQALKKMKSTCTLQTFLSWFPIINWLRNYKLEFLSGDIIAGVTCALTVIPQGIGYAPLAGLPLEVSII